MSVLFLFGGAIGLGFLLILMISVTAPKPPTVDLQEQSGGSFLVQLDAEQIGHLVGALLDKMGIEVDRVQGGKNEVVEIFAENPAPMTGGRILVHCVPAPLQTGTLDGPRVSKFVRAVRSAYVTKGLLFTTATLTPDGRLALDDMPVEVFDRDAIQRLIDEHLSPEEINGLALTVRSELESEAPLPVPS